MSRPPIGLLVAVALLGAAAGYYSFRPHPRETPLAPSPDTAAHAGSATEASAASNAAASEAAGDDEGAPPETPVPAEVPDLSLPDMAGKLHPLRDPGGHARLFNFWATWCEPCRREIPLLNGLQQQYAEEGLQVVGIAIDDRAAVQKFVKATPMRYQLLVGEDGGYEAAQKFGMALALPFSVFADGNNHVIAVKLGELHAEEAAAILANMRALRAGTTSLEAARENIAEALKSLAAERSKQATTK